MHAGIEQISFYSSHYYLDLKTMANARGIEPEKFYTGIGQEKMAVPPPDEDIVTMAANAALQILKDRDDTETISTLIFATESGIDQSKAAGIYVHKLLNLSSQCRIFEVKQACYSATGALQMALPYLLAKPDQKVLLIASDVARYGLDNAGEPTQGAGAVAMLLSTQPSILAFEPYTGIYTDDVMDFWRPNYRDEALVDGKYSVKIYIKSLLAAWEHYQNQTDLSLSDFHAFCYHLPFSRMGEKAHSFLLKTDKNLQNDFSAPLEKTLYYNKQIGNTYTASLYIGLTSLLENFNENLGDKRIGFFSYGSGCVGEFFSGIVQKDYKSFLHKEHHKNLIDERRELSLDEYKNFYTFSLPQDGSEFSTPQFKTGKFRLAGIKDHQRIYQRID